MLNSSSDDSPQSGDQFLPELKSNAPSQANLDVRSEAEFLTLETLRRKALVEVEEPNAELPPKKTWAESLHLATSTLISLAMVVVLLAIARWVVPPLVENIRYGWHRGQLRAEYELSDERLRSVSLDSLADVSQMVSQRVGPSVVNIALTRDEKMASSMARSLGMGPRSRLEGQGSGFVIDDEGHILTNNHVLEGNAIEVTLSDGRLLPAKIVGRDPATDLAVIKVDVTDLMPISWGTSEDITTGTPVWAVGSPFGLQQTVTFGIISGKHRIDFRGTHYQSSVLSDSAYGDLMQSDVALNPGNSGGPLVNARGEVIGVNAAILGETYQGVSFSIPSRVARRVARLLIEKGEVPRGWLGVSMKDLDFEERYAPTGQYLPGVRVTGFPRDGASPARDAGIESGDIIIKYNDSKVASQMELMRLIGETEVGDVVRITVLRDEIPTTINVTIGKRQLPAGR